MKEIPRLRKLYLPFSTKVSLDVLKNFPFACKNVVPLLTLKLLLSLAVNEYSPSDPMLETSLPQFPVRNAHF